MQSATPSHGESGATSLKNTYHSDTETQRTAKKSIVVQPAFFVVLPSCVHKKATFAALFAISAPLLFIFWLLFVGTFNQWELLVGAGVALIGALAICVVEMAEDSHFRPRAQDLAQIVFVPWLLLQGTYEILMVSLRDLLGGRKAISAFRVAQFQAGEVCDPQDTGRRVLATAYTTMAPNFIVFGINTPERQLLFHQIERSGVPKMTKNLGAVA